MCVSVCTFCVELISESEIEKVVARIWRGKKEKNRVKISRDFSFLRSCLVGVIVD